MHATAASSDSAIDDLVSTRILLAGLNQFGHQSLRFLLLTVCIAHTLRFCNVEHRLIDIPPASIERLKPLMLAMHAVERSVQPALGHAPVRTDDAFWPRYAEWFARAHAAGDGICIGAELLDGSLIGFVFGVVKEGDLGFETGDRVGYVEDISVLESARGSGIGRELMNAVRERFAELGLSSVKLSTVPGNDAARGFYASLGFKPAAQLLIGEL